MIVLTCFYTYYISSRLKCKFHKGRGYPVFTTMYPCLKECIVHRKSAKIFIELNKWIDFGRSERGCAPAIHFLVNKLYWVPACAGLRAPPCGPHFPGPGVRGSGEGAGEVSCLLRQPCTIFAFPPCLCSSHSPSVDPPFPRCPEQAGVKKPLY